MIEGGFITKEIDGILVLTQRRHLVGLPLLQLSIFSRFSVIHDAEMIDVRIKSLSNIR